MHDHERKHDHNDHCACRGALISAELSILFMLAIAIIAVVWGR